MTQKARYRLECAGSAAVGFLVFYLSLILHVLFLGNPSDTRVQFIFAITMTACLAHVLQKKEKRSLVFWFAQFFQWYFIAFIAVWILKTFAV